METVLVVLGAVMIGIFFIFLVLFTLIGVGILRTLKAFADRSLEMQAQTGQILQGLAKASVRRPQ